MNKNEMTNLSQYTKYPDIYKKTYWNGDMKKYCSDLIFENRNKFVKEFNIKKICKNKNLPSYLMKYIKPFFNKDYFESYLTNSNNFICVVHDIYDVFECMKTNCHNHGWKPIYKIFNDSSNSYVIELIRGEKYHNTNYYMTKLLTINALISFEIFDEKYLNNILLDYCVEYKSRTQLLKEIRNKYKKQLQEDDDGTYFHEYIKELDNLSLIDM